MAKCKKDISCMVDNIINQNGDRSSAAMLTFDLKSEKAFETWVERVSALFDCYGLDTEHNLSEK